MSQENVEVVRRGVEAFARGAWDESIEWMDPAVQWRDTPNLPGAQLYRGREGVLAQWRSTREVFDDFTVDIDQFIDAGDQVVVFMRTSGRGRASGLQVSREIVQVCTVRDGRVIEIVGYEDPAEALRAVGLSEEPAR